MRTARRRWPCGAPPPPHTSAPKHGAKVFSILRSGLPVRGAKGQRYIEINPRYMENHAVYIEITIQFSTHTEKNVEMCPLCVENLSSCIENYVSHIEMFAASST
jgi:hypothetical protein